MGKIRCANCDSVISDGQTQCLSCGSKDFYDEDEKKREEEKKELISKWKNMPRGKKTGIVLAIVGVFVFSIIMALLFPAEETSVDKIETSCYLTEMCYTSNCSITVNSVDYSSFYFSKEGNMETASSSKNLICLLGNLSNLGEESNKFSKGMFRLELNDQKELTPVNFVCNCAGNIFYDKVTLIPKINSTIFIYYEVDKSVKIEDCRLIYYDNAIALKNR